MRDKSHALQILRCHWVKEINSSVAKMTHNRSQELVGKSDEICHDFIERGEAAPARCRTKYGGFFRPIEGMMCGWEATVVHVLVELLGNVFESYAEECGGKKC